MSIRAQHLTVQLSKRVFESEEFGIVRSQDMLYGVENFNMQPLMIVGVSYEQLPIHYRQYVRVGESICLEKFLMDFWAYKHENPTCPEHPVTGKPDVLIIDHRLENVLAPSFLSWLTINGIQYDYSTSKSRKFSAVARQHQVYPDVKIEHHTPTQSTDGATECFKLTLENLNTEMKYQQFTYSMIPKPMRSLLQSSAWEPNSEFETVVEPVMYTQTFVDPEIMARHTQNDLIIYNPHWHKSTNEPYFQYGYLINNFVSDNALANKDHLRELSLGLIAMEYLWPTFEESIQLRLKQFKNKGYRNLDSLSQSDYNKLLYRTGIDTEAYINELKEQGMILKDEVHSFVYDISKMNVNDISDLWRSVVPASAKTFEVIPVLMEKKQKYRVFAAQTTDAQFIFICSCRYKKAAAFDQGICRGYKNGNVVPFDKAKFDTMVNDALAGQPNVFDELRTTAKKHIDRVA